MTSQSPSTPPVAADLETVEAVLNRHPQVLQSVVQLEDVPAGTPRLVAYVIDQRSTLRLPIEAACRVRSAAGGQWDTVIVDISPAGARVRVPSESQQQELRGGEVVHLLIESAELPELREIQGVVGWTAPRYAGIAFDTLPEIQFTVEEALARVARVRGMSEEAFTVMRSPRVAFVQTCEIEVTGGRRGELATVDLSVTGVRLTGIAASGLADAELVARPVRVRMTLPTTGERRWLSGIVVRRDEDDIGVSLDLEPGDRFWLERVVAAERRRDSFSSRSLFDFARDRLPAHLVPKTFVLAEDPPGTPIA